MKVAEILIENFLTIGKINARLDDRGLVLVQGVNDDDTSQISNGSGKSSFPDSLAWCLNDLTARGETGDAVINDTAKKNCRVQVTLVDGDQKYRVTRHRKHSPNKNRLVLEWWDDAAAAWTDRTLGTDKLTQVEVTKILGCSPEVFNAAIYAGQEQMPDLPGMTDKQLKLLVEEAAGIDQIEQGYEVARTRLRDAQAKESAELSRKEQLASQESELNARIASHRDMRTTWAQAQVSKAQAKLAETKTLKAQLIEASKKLQQTDRKAVETQLEATRDLINAVAGEQVQERELQSDVRHLERQEATGKNQVDNQRREIDHIKAHLDGIDHKIGEPCGECGKDYASADVAGAKKLAKDKLRNAINAAKLLVESLAKLRETLAKSEAALTAHRASMTDISAATSTGDALRAELRTINALESDVRSIEEQIREKVGEIRQLQAEPNPYDALIKRGDQEQQALVEKHTQNLVKLKECEADVKIAEAVARVFGPAGVRAHILDTVTPFLNQRTSHYLSHLTDGNISAVWQTLSKTAKGELREKFNIQAESLVGSKRYKGLSGGEKRKVRLACSMALQDLQASRATKPLNLYIADEIDDALDDAGLERLMAILTEKARDKGTVLVISHNALESWIPTTVTVRKSGGYSSMEGVALQ